MHQPDPESTTSTEASSGTDSLEAAWGGRFAPDLIILDTDALFKSVKGEFSLLPKTGVKNLLKLIDYYGREKLCIGSLKKLCPLITKYDSWSVEFH